MLDSARRLRPSLMARARVSPTPLTSSRSSMRGPHDLLEVAEAGDDALDDRLGQPRDLGQQPEAAGLEALVEVELLVGQVERGADGLEVEQVLGAEVGQRLEGLVDVPVGVLVEVVLDDQAAVVLDAAHQLVELQADEPALDAELDDAELDLLGDAPHHLGALEHGDDVAHGDEVLHLDGATGRR